MKSHMHLLWYLTAIGQMWYDNWEITLAGALALSFATAWDISLYHVERNKK